MHSVSVGPFGLAIDYVLMWGALLLAFVLLRFMVKNKVQHRCIENTLFSVFFAALLGARLGFVWRMWAQYQSDLLSVVDIRDGGFLPQAGILTGAIVLIYRVHRFPETRSPSLRLLLIIASVMMPVYAGVNWFNRAEKMPVPVVMNTLQQKIDLGSFTNKPIVLNVWATWCAPCRREMPVLENAQQRYLNIHFVFLNQGESASDVNRFLHAQSLDLKNVLLDPTGSVSREFGVSVLPTTLFYSPDGQLLYRHVGGVSSASLEYALQKVAKANP